MDAKEVEGIVTPGNAVLDTASRIATIMCNPDYYNFEVDWMDEDSVHVNCVGLGALCSDCTSYCDDVATAVEGLLNKYCGEDGKWVMCSDPNYYDRDGIPMDSVDDNAFMDGDTVQYMIYRTHAEKGN